MYTKQVAVCLALVLIGVFVCTAEANLVTNGTFDADTDWTKVPTSVIQNGYAQLGSGGDNRGAVHQTISTTADAWYKLTFKKGHVGNTNNSGIMATTFNGAGNANANAFWGTSHWGQDAATVTGYFRAEGGSTTVQFRDFSYVGASHDPTVDNVVVEAVTSPQTAEVNIAGWAALSQSDYYNATNYPATYGVDGVANNFMHTQNVAPRWFDLTFDQDYDVTRVAISPREGYLNRIGETITFYDSSDTPIAGTATLGDSGRYYARNNGGAGWSGVRRIRIEETDNVALNFAEFEVYTSLTIPEPATFALAAVGLLGWRRGRRR